MIRGVIINTKELSPTHINHAHLNGTSLPRNILSLVTPPTHCNDTVPHTLTHKDHPLIPVISQIDIAVISQGVRVEGWEYREKWCELCAHIASRQLLFSSIATAKSLMKTH